MTETEIDVECTSMDEWIEAGDRAHIELMGDSPTLKFDYKITGLEKTAKYSIELVFTPDLTQRFTRSHKPDGSWEFACKKEDPTADINKLTSAYTHPQGLEIGAKWMATPIKFDSIVFRTTREGGEREEEDELCLESGLKYQVAVRIKKEGVEEAVYEEDVPDQVFVACEQRSEPEEEVNTRKRKSEGCGEVDKKRPNLEGSPEGDQPRSSGDTTPTPESNGPRPSLETTPSPPEGQNSPSREASPPREFRLPTFGQAPPPGAMPTFTNRPPPPYQAPPSNRPPAFAAPPPVEEAPADAAQEEEEEDTAPVRRPRIGTNQFSAFDRVGRRPT